MKESKEKEYPFINEIIVPKKKNKWLVRLETLVVVIVMAVVFGFVARWAFLISDGYLKSWLGIEEQQRIELVGTRQSSVIKGELSKEQTGYEQINKIAEHIASSIVTIKITREKMDLFQESYIVNAYTTGVLISRSDTKLFILTDVEKMFEDDAVTVCFNEMEFSGEIYCMEKDYGIAIISVTLSTIPKELLETMVFASFGNDKITVGTQVLALGRPNGYDSMVVSRITSVGHSVSALDGAVPYFTTDMIDHRQGNGFLFNFHGELLGMITHVYKQNVNDEISSAISLNEIRCVIESCLNLEPIAWFGIKGTDLPASMQWLRTEEGNLELLHGVYVTEVQSSSPAFHLGLKVGEIVVEINGKEINGITQFKELLLNYDVGDNIWLRVYNKESNNYYTAGVKLVEKNKK